jgi:thiol-disulfide isomerase/thioredoxin
MNENASIVGKEIPYFKFYTIDGTEKSLDDFKGKYVYLNFMRTDIVPAMESMDRLINFYNNHKKDIEIVSVFTDEDSNNFYRLDSTKYTWDLLYVKENKQELIDFFHLITWPQFYLISPEGKLIMAPAPSLKEDFEIRFFEKIDSYKHR